LIDGSGHRPVVNGRLPLVPNGAPPALKVVVATNKLLARLMHAYVRRIAPHLEQAGLPMPKQLQANEKTRQARLLS